MSALPCVRARDRMGERREDSRRRCSQELQARTGKGRYIFFFEIVRSTFFIK